LSEKVGSFLARGGTSEILSLQASCFLQYCQRYDWTIIPCSSTPKQKAAVRFCEEVLNIEFEGNIESKQECSQFLTEYLDLAKQFYMELKCEYETDY